MSPELAHNLRFLRLYAWIVLRKTWHSPLPAIVASLLGPWLWHSLQGPEPVKSAPEFPKSVPEFVAPPMPAVQQRWPQACLPQADCTKADAVTSFNGQLGDDMADKADAAAKREAGYGIMKPDGTTITIGPQSTLSVRMVGGGGGGGDMAGGGGQGGVAVGGGGGGGSIIYVMEK